MDPSVGSELAYILKEITFEWADSYDAKDWDRLRKILAPTLRVDYSEVTGESLKVVSRDEFVDIVSSENFVGDPLVDTQHLVGASRFTRASEDEVQGFHQIRAAHQRYTSPDKTQVEAKGHGHALIRHDYKRMDGKWLLAGLRPTVRWNEYDFEKIFKGH
ncbi:scytalone dehydratase [Aspergillus terreus]|uniref:Scytalone dehydratase n=1 Tax=Aspergillus terreus TaxID=33178 RepID=A0A5M3ZB35_ASPTE|nr:hypothetical protein ATETN484_0011015300 [Aspergillus terreus]GFF18790.1 scytalone dehydratase [Aspergillus terreus]